MQGVFVAHLVLFRTMILIKRVWLSPTVKTGIVTYESVFLFQRLSIALQKYNEVCIRGTFCAMQDNDSG